MFYFAKKNNSNSRPLTLKVYQENESLLVKTLTEGKVAQWLVPLTLELAGWSFVSPEPTQRKTKVSPCPLSCDLCKHTQCTTPTYTHYRTTK